MITLCYLHSNRLSLCVLSLNSKKKTKLVSLRSALFSKSIKVLVEQKPKLTFFCLKFFLRILDIFEVLWIYRKCLWTPRSAKNLENLA